MRHAHKPLPAGCALVTLRGGDGVLEGHSLRQMRPDKNSDDAVVLPNSPADLRTIADVLYAVAAYLEEEPVGTKLPRPGA
jgi:hypothetical protein